MKQSDILDVISIQNERLKDNVGMTRDVTDAVTTPLDGFATVISGIRRCGKSTLMAQVISRTDEPSLYLNFDTPRLNGFSINDFELVDAIARERNVRYLFFDEIQLVEGWETYVRSALDEGYHVMVTGSNATMLSQELGTRLTGRHITKELFPFSYAEYCRFRAIETSADSLSAYLSEGGFPQYLNVGDEVVLQSLLDDILFRDIAVRHGVKDVVSLRSLMLYLISNISNLVSANKMTDIIHVKTAKTVLEYFSYCVQTYLVAFVPRYAYSYKSQIVNPKKVYCIDNGLHNAVTTSSMSDVGRRLENMAYGELRRRHNQIYYYNEGYAECDFVVCEKNQPVAAYQVCYELNADNESREFKGLTNAMKSLNITNGYILTLNQTDMVLMEGLRLQVLPVWQMFGGK